MGPGGRNIILASSLYRMSEAWGFPLNVKEYDHKADASSIQSSLQRGHSSAAQSIVAAQADTALSKRDCRVGGGRGGP